MSVPVLHATSVAKGSTSLVIWRSTRYLFTMVKNVNVNFVVSSSQDMIICKTTLSYFIQSTVMSMDVIAVWNLSQRNLIWFATEKCLIHAWAVWLCSAHQISYKFTWRPTIPSTLVIIANGHSKTEPTWKDTQVVLTMKMELGRTIVKFAILASVPFLILQDITRDTLRDANFVAKSLKLTGVWRPTWQRGKKNCAVNVGRFCATKMTWKFMIIEGTIRNSAKYAARNCFQSTWSITCMLCINK